MKQEVASRVLTLCAVCTNTECGLCFIWNEYAAIIGPTAEVKQSCGFVCNLDREQKACFSQLVITMTHSNTV